MTLTPVFGLIFPTLSYIILGLLALMSLLYVLSFLMRKRPPVKKDLKDVIVLKKGYDIPIKGAPAGDVQDVKVTRFAIQPKNFRYIFPIPKLTVAVGDQVQAGDVLFFDRDRPDIKFVSPVSGTVEEILRGAKRSISEVVIRADETQHYRALDVVPETAERARLVAFLAEAGVWPMINQRPYDVIPDFDKVPRDIFISTFDTAPLAPDGAKLVEGREAAFQKGLDILARLTSGSVHLGLDGRKDIHPAFANAKGVKKHYFSGFHPAGNVGIHIHHIAPIRGGEDVVWTLGVQEVITIGTLFTEGKFDATRIVAIGGNREASPRYVRTFQGAHIGELLGYSPAHDVRVISGDVLTGERKTEDEFLNYFDDQISVIDEGDYYEMFGWLLPSRKVPTVSYTYKEGLFPSGKPMDIDANTHGEKRAFVMTGEYERMLPMDLFPQHLMKAILVADYERMEALGIHELSEEDIALCEFACTSKQPLQQILRQGLSEMMSE